LQPEAHERIVDPAVGVAVSAATVWEVAIKRALGKLRLDGSMEDHLRGSAFRSLAITSSHAERAGALPPVHRDPFDRMLVAQALSEGLTLVTRDPVFDNYDVSVLRG
jgi:PIN domain nuclease of toxin-antitoxin system